MTWSVVSAISGTIGIDGWSRDGGSYRGATQDRRALQRDRLPEKATRLSMRFKNVDADIA